MANNGKSTDNNLSSSLTDLMTSLMVIFILLLVVTLNNKSREASAKVENTLNAILNELQSDFAADGLIAEKDPKDPLGLLILVPEKFFNFEIDKSTIPSGGIDFLQNFAPRLAMITCDERFKNEISSIVVEGHADSTGGDEYNLPLSQQRAMSVVQEILKIMRNQKESQMQCFLDFLSASGRGNRELKYDDDGNEDQDKSRRVEFKVRVHPKEHREIIKQLGN